MLGELPPPAEVLDAARRDRPARGRAGRAAALADALADDDLARRERRNVIPALCDVTVDCRLLPGQTPRGRRAADPRRCSARATTSSSGSSGGAARARRSETPLWERDRALGRATPSPGARRVPVCCAGLHRLPLAARRVRHRRVRLLPDADDGSGARGAADPLGRRAHPRRGSRARRRVPALARPLAGLGMLELWSPEGAFERIEAYLRERGFFAPGGEELVADLYLGYGLSERAAPHAGAAAARAVPAAALACRGPSRTRRTCPAPDTSGGRSGSAAGSASWTDDDYARRRRGGARRDRARRRLPGQPRPAPRRATSPATRARSPPRSRRSRRSRRSARRRRLGDRLRLARSSSSRAAGGASGRCRSRARARSATRRARRAEKDAAEHVMIVDLERNDLSRVCEPGSRALARADGRARARRRRAPRLARSRARCARTSALAELLAATFPGGSVTGAPKIAARRPDRARSSRSAAAPRWARSGGARRTATSSSR